MTRFLIPGLTVLLLAACARYEWTPVAPDGTPFAQAQAECASLARERVRGERYFGDKYEPGPAGFPPDSPRDLEYRETEACLLREGFTKIRVE